MAPCLASREVGSKCFLVWGINKMENIAKLRHKDLPRHKPRGFLVEIEELVLQKKKSKDLLNGCLWSYI